MWHGMCELLEDDVRYILVSFLTTEAIVNVASTCKKYRHLVSQVRNITIHVNTNQTQLLQMLRNKSFLNVTYIRLSKSATVSHIVLLIEMFIHIKCLPCLDHISIETDLKTFNICYISANLWLGKKRFPTIKRVDIKIMSHSFDTYMKMGDDLISFFMMFPLLKELNLYGFCDHLPESTLGSILGFANHIERLELNSAMTVMTQGSCFWFLAKLKKLHNLQHFEIRDMVHCTALPSLLESLSGLRKLKKVTIDVFHIYEEEDYDYMLQNSKEWITTLTTSGHLNIVFKQEEGHGFIDYEKLRTTFGSCVSNQN